MNRIEIDLKTGKKRTIPLTGPEIAAANKRTADEKKEQKQQNLTDLKQLAISAELELLVNVA